MVRLTPASDWPGAGRERRAGKAGVMNLGFDSSREIEEALMDLSQKGHEFNFFQP